MNFTIIVWTPDTENEIVLVQDGQYTQATLEERKDIAPFIQFYKNACGGPCPCYTICRNRLTPDEEEVSGIEIKDCLFCAGDTLLIWEDETSKPTDPRYIGKETIFYRQDRPMYIDMSIYDDSWGADYTAEWYVTIGSFKGQLVIIEQDRVIREANLRSSDLRHFVEFYKRNEMGQCPCHIRKFKNPENPRLRPTDENDLYSSMIITNCTHCHGEGRLLWWNEPLVTVPTVLNIGNIAGRACILET
jgi:hypothetical protein